VDNTTQLPDTTDLFSAIKASSCNMFAEITGDVSTGILIASGLQWKAGFEWLKDKEAIYMVKTGYYEV
jgi:hypothetical protein